jgi:DNA (cytosine-5)-methyltransferase 1
MRCRSMREEDPPLGPLCSKAVTHCELSIVGLFAGIGGLEEGFRRRGHHGIFLCDSDPAARRVLEHRFPEASIDVDVRDLRALPKSDVVTAGFPCQDLSQVGRCIGIHGPHSGLIGNVFDLLRSSRSAPRWLVLENVPFMLRLDGGRAIQSLVQALDDMGWAWAYRTIDARAFGLPQRRRRVILLASRESDPRPALFGTDAGPPAERSRANHACGFYWTEGNTGLGWAVDAIPPLKGGSALNIPSPPAIWFPRRRLVATPTIEDAERLQGFAPGWTRPAELESKGKLRRWRLVGNAVSVPMAEWIAERLCFGEVYDSRSDNELATAAGWPCAGWGFAGKHGHPSVSEWPVQLPYQHLAAFLRREMVPLSRKATAGFLSRLQASRLRFERAFLDDLRHHIAGHDDREAHRSGHPKHEPTHVSDQGARQPAGAVAALHPAPARAPVSGARWVASG